MLDLNVVFAIIIGISLGALIKFVFPLYKDRDSIYKDIKQGLLLFGYAFRDDKLKAMTDTIFNIVSIIEQYDKSNITKQYEAMEQAYNELLSEFDIVLDDEVVELLVDIAVSHLPPTNHKRLEQDSGA